MFYPYEENEINYKDSVYGIVVGNCKNGILIRLENDDVRIHRLVIYKKVQRFYVRCTEKPRKTRMLMYV